MVLSPHLLCNSCTAQQVFAVLCMEHDHLCEVVLWGFQNNVLVQSSLTCKVVCMIQLHCLFVSAVLFVINRCVDACFLADMFIQALLGFLDKKRNRWEGRPRVTIMTYCKHWLAVDMLSVVPYDAIVILVPSHLKLKVMLGPVSWYMCMPVTYVFSVSAPLSTTSFKSSSVT